MASAVMLYGFSLLYGFTGTSNIYSLAAAFDEGQLSNIPVIGSLIIILVGFGFKISAVPFHFWAPDVYEGAPTPVAGFLSTASKAAGFAVLVRVFFAAYPDFSFEWSAILAVIAVATMTLGNLIALAQKNIKRLLAYSSIAHAGYILLGIVVANEFGIASSIYYLLAYLVTNLAAFGTVGVYGRAIGSDEIAAYAGMSRRAPALALVLMVSMLSLAGMPPLGGFIAKVFVFAAVVRVDMIWLAVIGILNSIIGLYYYLVVLKVVYLYRSEDEDKPLAISRSAKFALVMLTIAIILLGTVFSPWYNLATSAAAAMF
jgi:NADH-quinone oxidoreductase subunit N